MIYVKGISGDQLFQDQCKKCHRAGVPPLPAGIPKTIERLRGHKGSLQICKGCNVEKLMPKEDIINVIKFLRVLPRQAQAKP
ncbi:MAG: hypothetical protein GY862_33390 [Gammaproteobacteria bacterium]|nr:hypothetical protein [Gammaproteobacteria bacterium]